MTLYHILFILSVTLLASNVVSFKHTKQFPVPLVPGERNAVHGWLILPTEQEAPFSDPTTPVDAWFVHHTPEFWTDSPHNFQIILFGTIVPLSVAENLTVAINLPYPPATPLLGTEYTITPPPPFSLNDLLLGNITSLLGVVYNGSFDTSYERIADSIAQLTIYDLTTAVYLDNSSSIQPYPEMRYLSYPRKPDSFIGEQHYYLSHEIHSAPDFDQVIHIVVNVDDCVCSGCPSDFEKYTYIQQPGVEWAIPDLPNTLEERLLPSQNYVTSVLLTAPSNVKIQCKWLVVEEIHCVVGPDFFNICPK
eukprot:TRINITY_DN7081_c2_g2_i1.p1 TRINITY_DN7081_c2_g2~~TRINITY_DN7081_c2_g2_i1.p1  ORF type:complete len:306 (-),score=36.01 TRINITY_DN7081_c2_g2_i1:13-930(-)